MKLNDVASAPGGVTLDQLVTDDDLKRDLQQRLADLGCLDPPPDGNFGPVSQIMLAKAAEHAGVAYDSQVLTPELAQALLDHNVDTLIPLQLDGGFASRIVRYLAAVGWWFCRVPGFHNIVYVEGVNEDGSVNADTFDQFNDRRMVVTVQDGQPTLLHNVLATTEPSRLFTDDPPDPNGVARIAFGPYKAWHVGIHHPGKPSAHEALIQAANVSVFRDKNRDHIRPGDALFTGLFGINQHSGFNAPVGAIGRASAGCLVARTTQDHRDFMALVKTDERYRMNSGYKFLTTVINGDELATVVP